MVGVESGVDSGVCSRETLEVPIGDAVGCWANTSFSVETASDGDVSSVVGCWVPQAATTRRMNLRIAQFRKADPMMCAH